MLAIIALLLSNAWWINHSYKHKTAGSHYAEHVRDFPLLDPALPFYEKKNLIVNIQDIRDYLRGVSEQNKDWADISIYFEVVNTGANVSVNNETKILPASLMKLPIGMIAMKKVQDGEWSLDDTMFELTKEDVDYATAPEVASEIGKSYNLEFLIERLLLVSDNAAFNLLSKQMNDADLEKVAESVGLDVILDDDGKLSAKDYTRLLRSLYSATYLDEEHSEKLLELMDRSKFNEFLSAAIPDEVPFAHKWGANLEYNIYSDSGIMYAKDRPYLISVMIQSKGDKIEEGNRKAKELMQQIGEKVYLYVIKK